MSTGIADFLANSGGDNFTESGPRPPALGKEDRVASSSTKSSGSRKSRHSSKSANSSDGLTPRKSTLTEMKFGCEPPLGFEPEGSTSFTPPCVETPSLRPCLRWAESLRNLLDDPEGINLFRIYLKQERCEDSLNFWLACEGLKKQPVQDVSRIHQLVRVIHTKFLKSRSVRISERAERTLNDRIANLAVTNLRTIFDESQTEVEHLIADTTYPNFLHSDVYLKYVQQEQASACSSVVSSPRLRVKHSSGSSTSSSASSTTSEPGLRAGYQPGAPLAAVDEDGEMEFGAGQSMSLALTARHLFATQKMRASEFVRYEPQDGPYRLPSKPYHASYAQYNTTSAQDSELQSLSSDARTDSDVMSMSGSSVDGHSYHGGGARMQRRHHKLQQRAIKNSAVLNADPMTDLVQIPRTKMADKREMPPSDPNEFMALLTAKLELHKRKVKDELEKKSRVHSALQKIDKEEREICETVNDPNPNQAPQFCTPYLLDAVYRERHAVTDDTDQSILDDHVQRIWSSDSASRTPPPYPDYYQHDERRRAPVPPPPRRPPDTFSIDSGTVPDYGGMIPIDCPPTAQSYHNHTHHHITVVSQQPGAGVGKEYPPTTFLHPKAAAMLRKFGVGAGGRSSGGSKGDLASVDSGLSSVSGPTVTQSNESVTNWVSRNERYQAGGSSGPCSFKSDVTDKDQRHRRNNASSSSSTADKQCQRTKKPLVYSSASRTGALDHGVANWVDKPKQPFLTDPSMPMLPQPNTETQLVEACRILVIQEEELNKKPQSKSRTGLYSSKDKLQPLDLSRDGAGARPKQMAGLPVRDVPLSPMSISGNDFDKMKKMHKRTSSVSSSLGNPPTASSSCVATPCEPEYTVVGYCFRSDPVPYRTKIQGRLISLQQFKQVVGKKGNFRYFFKKASDEFKTGVVNEEITDDSEILPLWEGKIFATIEPTEM